ncbi:MAG: tripartite tricarboxylate transporter substrate binding protein [Betaproteobacteria bacterium]|nr:tripartite tricarboxylate transporter substrate binding protein [Betaproteobacteria bacterium]
MNNRTAVWSTVCCMGLFGVIAQAAWAQVYPSRPIRMVVPYTAGGGVDIVARILAPRMSEILGQQVIVENRTGATGIIAAEYVAKSAADGHTLLVATTSMLTVQPTARQDLPYNPAKDFRPVTMLVFQPFLLIAGSAFPANTVKELLSLAQARPGGLSYASFGNGSPPHLGTELLKLATGIDMVHVPYKGGAPALPDMIGGRLSAMFIDMPPVMQHIKAGRLKVLGVSTPERTALMPDVPTVAETVPNFGFSAWFGVVAPAGTSTQVIAKLSTAIDHVLATPEVKEQLAGIGCDAAGKGPDDFSALIVSETEKWKKVIKAIGLKLE